MSFGPTMRLDVDGLTIELAAHTKLSMERFVEGMAQLSVTQYLQRNGTAPSLEDEHEWYDKIRTDKTRIHWGIWVIQEGRRTLIGDTVLLDITREHIHQATSGSVIFDKQYWGKGIASSIHKARTWYAFQHLGLHRIMSAVVQGNIASRKALEKSGYRLVYVERNTSFVNGQLRHQDNLAALNPLPVFWGQWWHGEEPDAEAIAALTVTESVMAWAEKNVVLL